MEFSEKNSCNIAKIGDGHDESPTCMVGDNKTSTKQLSKIGGILKPSWASLRPKVSRKVQLSKPLPKLLNVQSGGNLALTQ